MVSDHGRVWSIPFSRLRDPARSKNGYLLVSSSAATDGANFLVHRLVAAAFVPGHFEGTQVNHKDGNKENNHYLNLEWVTQAENNRHAFATGLRDTKLSAEDIERLKQVATASERRLTDIAAEFGVSPQYVGQLLKGKHRAQEATDLSHRPLRGKLSEQEARSLIEELRSGQAISVIDLAAKYGVSPANVSNIIAGRTWKVLTGGPIDVKVVGRYGRGF